MDPNQNRQRFLTYMHCAELLVADGPEPESATISQLADSVDGAGDFHYPQSLGQLNDFGLIQYLFNKRGTSSILLKRLPRGD
jgi:hypothetical protein